MARLPRLALAGHAHLVIQRGHNGHTVFADAQDRQQYLAALREAAAGAQVALHAYALLDNEVRLLATPAQAAGLARLIQALGRRYVGAYNRRHGRSGTLWDGRFRCALLEPGDNLLRALLWVDTATAEPERTSSAHRTGGALSPALTDPPEYWALGNTPFERQARYGAMLQLGVPAPAAQQLRDAALGGWAVGSAAFTAAVAEASARPSRPRPRGRPRRKVGATAPEAERGPLLPARKTLNR